MTLLPNGKTRIAVCFAFLAACGIYGTFARGEQPAAALSPHPSVSPGVSAAPPQVMGWRNDGSGRYPLATPPREWSETKNILWKTKVGPNKYSSPILVAARLFLLSDPAWLCCVSANDGSPLAAVQYLRRLTGENRRGTPAGRCRQHYGHSGQRRTVCLCGLRNRNCRVL